MRFTVDGSEILEAQIARDMDVVRGAVVEAVGDDISGLVLGGGYGRGEGGVHVVAGEERVYNDYDFFVVVPYSSRPRRKAVSAKLAAVKAAVEPGCGIHVDFSPPMPEASLPNTPEELMFMELRAGHHVVIGRPDILSTMSAYDISRPPLEEGARLFMNRGFGLVLARRLLDENPAPEGEDHEFVVRNIYKALMAAGDAVLFVNGNYDASYVERRRRVAASDLPDLPWGDALQRAYDEAIGFKLRPRHEIPPEATLLSWHANVTALFCEVFLWFERHRFGRPDLSWKDYTGLPSRLPRLSRQDMFKNVVRNLRSRSHGDLPLAECRLHPRDRILKRLPGHLAGDNNAAASFPLIEYLWANFG
jgi:hypothetical protein